MRHTRREFIRKSAVLGGFAPLAAGISQAAGTAGQKPYEESPVLAGGQQNEPELHVFSKHLQFLDYEDMARAASDLGFAGVDLTVRPGGHVEPEQVRQDLPRAVDAVRNAGLLHRMMTTAVDDPADRTDRDVLSAAAEAGVELYRMNWLRFDQEQSLPESVRQFRKRLKDLGELNRELGIVGCYQNHAGLMAGASMWELYNMLEEADPEVMGVQYDIRHATVEGGLSWQNGLRLVHPRIRTLALKDFRWRQEEDGQWRAENTPIGEGMVDFSRYFRLLKEYGVNVPVSVHYEYPLGGAEHGRRELTVRPEVVYRAMEKDLETIRRLWAAA